MNRNLIFTSIFVFTAFLAYLWTGAPPGISGNATPGLQEAENPLAHEINVTGTVIVEHGDYYIRGQTPKGVFRIINPIPEILERAVASGRPVSIEARIVQGDNLAIERIDNRIYRQAESGER